MTLKDRLPRNYVWAANRAWETLRAEGPRAFGRRTAAYVRRRGLTPPAPRKRLPATPISRPMEWPTSVLCVALPDPLQCWHYRVEQKEQACAALGIPFRVVSPHDELGLISALQLASVLLIFRQSWSPALERAAGEARRLGIPVVWECDDLVYRRDAVAANPNLDTVPRSLRQAVISGADGYRDALVRADAVLASTGHLAQDMANLTGRPAHVMDNGIDEVMLSIAEGIELDPARPPAGEQLVVGYGSGSRAHDLDLALIARALGQLLQRRPAVILRLFGPVRVPDELAPFGERIERVGSLDRGEYLRQLSRCDLTLAPLVDLEFNRYKSQVKYLEAALVGVPLLASHVVYADYVVDGVTGMLAADGDWLHPLLALVDDEALRSQLAKGAREHVEQWRTDRLGVEQLEAFLAAVSATESVR